MIPLWLFQSVRMNQVTQGGDVELSVKNGVHLWMFELQKNNIPEKNYRIEFEYQNPDSNDKNYQYEGSFLVPSWVDLSFGSAIIFQWHSTDGTSDNIVLRIDQTNIRLEFQRQDSADIVAVDVPYARDTLVSFSSFVNWNAGTHKGIINNTPYEYTGSRYKNMLWKYGIYRTQIQDNPENYWPPVQIWEKATREAL